MRSPIFVQVEPFEIETAQPRLDAVREAFVRYLSEAKLRSSGTKHGLMGPIGKIINEVRSGRRDPPSLKGYALRVHEAGKTYPSSKGLNALENGIDGLVSLLSETPITAHDRLLDRLDYGLYYDLRKAALAAKEARRQMFVAFLRRKYFTEAELSTVWDVAIFEDIYLPKKSEGSAGKRATQKQRDIHEFWQSGSGASANEEEE